MSLYTKDGGFPAPLPDEAWGINAEGERWLYSPLAGFPESIEAAGYQLAPDAPEFDARVQQLAWDRGAWKVEPLPPVVIAASLDAAREALIERLGAIRWERQQSFAYNGGIAASDREAVTNVMGKVFIAQLTGRPADAKSSWKFGPGNFAEVTTADLVAYGAAMDAHVQACFDAERVKADLIEQAASFEELEAVDILTGWPGE